MSKNVTVKLPYGKGYQEFTLPQENLLAVLEPAPAPGLADPAAAVRDAMRAPIGRPPLAEMVKDGQYVLVIIDDITRPTPTAQLLPTLIEEIESHGSNLRIEILIATGTHRAHTEAENEIKVGRPLMDRFPVISHNALDPTCLIDLGTTANGTPIKVNAKVMEADLVVAIGNTVPHCLAGWAGGAKIIQPGVCGEDTTSWTHALSMISPVPHLGRLENPMRREIEEVVKKVRLDFMINTVLNDKSEVVAITGGDPNASQRQAVEISKKVWTMVAPGLGDIVIASSYPADIDFWQGMKGLQSAEPVVKRGGDIILASPCYEGLTTNPHHLHSVRAMQDVPSRMQRIAAAEQGITDLAGINFSVIAARINELAFVQFVSDGMSDQDLAALGHTRANSVQEALATSFMRQGPAAKVLVITHGGETAALAG